jgi:hypothetical protein
MRRDESRTRVTGRLYGFSAGVVLSGRAAGVALAGIRRL